MPNYTKEDDAKLIEMSKSGYTSRQIAAFLNRTRNSILGRLFRLKEKMATPAGKRKDAPILVKIDKVVTSFPDMGGCVFPSGHPGDIDFKFCEKPVAHGQVYCAECCKVAYQKWGKRWVK